MMLHKLERVQSLNWLVTYLYLPYQLLQIAGYRLAGKQCTYQWGTYRPEPMGQTSRRQHLVAGIFPTVVLLILLTLQAALSLYLFTRYYSPQTTWVVILLLVQPLFPFCLYGYLMVFDFLRLRRLLSS